MCPYVSSRVLKRPAMTQRRQLLRGIDGKFDGRNSNAKNFDEFVEGRHLDENAEGRHPDEDAEGRHPDVSVEGRHLDENAEGRCPDENAEGQRPHHHQLANTS